MSDLQLGHVIQHDTAADEFPSPSPDRSMSYHPSDEGQEEEEEQAAQAISAAVAASSDQHHHGPSTSSSRFIYTPHTVGVGSNLSNSEQIAILREHYSRNPNPGKRELEMLAEKTGRPWNRIREYFRQRRNKLRGLDTMEEMEEPGRATGWLQVTYRTAPQTSHVSQLNLYNSYRLRFDPYSSQAPLLGGQELIQLACATFPGCELARDDDKYILKGLKERMEMSMDHQPEPELAEPIRASNWLLNNYHPSESNSITQTDLYSSYATRYSLPAHQTSEPSSPNTQRLQDLENLAAVSAHPDHLNFSTDNGFEGDEDKGNTTPPRLLNPVELISLTKIAFPDAVPAVDEQGRFVIKGLERREGVEKSRGPKMGDIYPFALMTAPAPSDPDHPLRTLIKRKLTSLEQLETSSEKKRKLTVDDEELLDGLKRFRNSDLGREVRDVCVQQ
ncbi:hypothetical protein TREMEDRAFT_63083 [Tremella mesenterica DSM 1558]|uniref:uncharacterized protein n=1 Tax=Tremella mesenterica (strain ATCC 24925 / CBS 8224 / DSM 1558 / NBRC 9311 / NRRL Y-6157 / RJB 2259-6 / UBC 559-6) TaxID=578456 RepID=UPI0003F49033|nr:uncharacterized protein TREMEDRAFT_63083 [Tremella mesenterica DSM 1558]EIW68615.1 hypothetical protein TREMEDRAFT_63083 [Tremella mesenterica DSM 1558]